MRGKSAPNGHITISILILGCLYINATNIHVFLMRMRPSHAGKLIILAHIRPSPSRDTQRTATIYYHLHVRRRRRRSRHAHLMRVPNIIYLLMSVVVGWRGVAYASAHARTSCVHRHCMYTHTHTHTRTVCACVCGAHTLEFIIALMKCTRSHTLSYLFN